MWCEERGCEFAGGGVRRHKEAFFSDAWSASMSSARNAAKNLNGRRSPAGQPTVRTEKTTVCQFGYPPTWLLQLWCR